MTIPAIPTPLFAVVPIERQIQRETRRPRICLHSLDGN
jgi:hypothetical protein